MKIPKGGHQNPYIEKQTIQWRKEKVQKGKHKDLKTKHTHKAKDRVTRTPLKTGSELRCSGRVTSAWSTSGIHRVNLVSKICNQACVFCYCYIVMSMKRHSQYTYHGRILLLWNSWVILFYKALEINITFTITL